jgi:hypothetical protein
VSTPSDDRVRDAIFASLSVNQIESCVVYVATAPVAAGPIAFGRITVRVPWAAWLAFVDLEPAANWTHACRYVCVSTESGDTHSLDADRPPFGPPSAASGLTWKVLYRAPAVPAALLAIPDNPRS